MAHNEQLFEQLNKLTGSRTLILTIGNTLKADDTAGPLLYQQLKGKTSAELIDAATVPENYIQTIIKKAPQNLLIVDAVDFGAPPGTIKIFEPEQLNPSVISTHTLSPRVFIDMIRSELNVDVYFIGIQPARTNLGRPASPAIIDAVRKLSNILAEIFPL